MTVPPFRMYDNQKSIDTASHLFVCGVYVCGVAGLDTDL